MKIKKVQVGLLFCVFLLIPFMVQADEDDIDPFTSVEVLDLKNGLKVFLAPSEQAKLTSIRLEVDVGWDAEESQNWGVSHLLEHVLFRDKQLKDGMSYLQLIREAGGEANGTTQARLTSYFGSVPAKKGEWLLQRFAKMILDPSISEDYVKKEKGTVELERGRPGPVTQLLGFNPMDILNPNYLQSPDFWESEFNVSFDEKFTLAQEQLSTQRLTLQQVETHYQDYYYPSNMRLYIAGKYNRSAILKQIEEKWATLPNRDGKKLPAELIPIPVHRPYRRIAVTAETPYIYLGTKLINIDLIGSQVAASYVDYLAHRLMKEIRNLKGQTYTASGDSYDYKGAGYAQVSFQTPKENVQDNITFAKQYLLGEAEHGTLTAEQVNEAKELYLAKYKLMGREAKDLMWLATQYQSILHEYGKFTSPYEVLQSLSVEDYNAKLREAFSAEQRYEVIWQAPLLFPYDYVILYLFVALITFGILRFYLTKDFENDQIRWIRKVKYPHLKSLELLVCFVSWFIYIHIMYPYEAIFRYFIWLQSSVILSHYLMAVGRIVLGLLLVQGIVSLIPRKLMVVGPFFIVKTLSYYSKKIPLTEISSIEVLRAMHLPFSFKRLFKVGFRYYFYNPLFWSKGLLIHLKNGKSLFFSISNAEKARVELQKILDATLDVKSVLNKSEVA